VSDIKVAVLGAGGRMGAQACAAIEAADGLHLVARLGRDDTVSGETLIPWLCEPGGYECVWY